MASTPLASTSASTQLSAPEPTSMTTFRSASNITPIQASNSHTSDIIRITCPLPTATYGHKLQCILMNYLQGPLHETPQCPRGSFLPENVTEELIHHRTISSDHPAIFQYALTSLPNLKNIEISIYVYKDTPVTPRGRKHYRIDALAVCFDHDGWMIIGPSEDLCRGFLSFEWYNDKIAYTKDWDEMSFEEMLRLLRRTSKRNFDQFGALRSDEDRLKMDQELGNIFPARGSSHPPVDPDMLHRFVQTKKESP